MGTSTNWDSVAAGYVHIIALTKDGKLWSWGNDAYGQLGVGKPSNHQKIPKLVDPGPWLAVAAGEFHSLAIKSNGTLWAWGYDNFGALGLGDTDAAYTPTQVGTKTDWISVAAGKHHTLALKSDGTLWAWGKGDDGQLGQCTHEIIEETELVCTWVSGVEICETIVITKVVCGDVRTPSQVGTDTDWVSVAGGEKHTVAIRGPARFDFKPYIGNGRLAEGTQVDASAKVIPTDGSRPYYLTNFTANPTTGGSSFTVESDLNFTWTYEPAIEVAVAFQGVPDGVRANAGPNPPEGKNQFVEGSEVNLQVLPVVTDPDTGTTYVCTGWTGTGGVPPSDTGSSVTVANLTLPSSITWNYAEARSLTTEFEGLPEHLQTDDFDPRGPGKGWDPQEPVWLVKDTTQTLTPPSEIYDQGDQVRYVLDLNDSERTGALPSQDLDDNNDGTAEPFDLTQDFTVTWKYRKEVRLRIGFGMGGIYDATDIIKETGLKVDGDSPPGDAVLPIDYYFEAFGLESKEPGEVMLPVTIEVKNTVQLGGEHKNCTGLVVLTGNSPLTEVDTTLNPVPTSFQLTKPTEVVWNYVDAQQQFVGSHIIPPDGVDPSREPEIQLLSHAATSTVENSFYWDEAEDKLYATHTLGSALLKWYKDDGSNQTIDRYIYAVWPTAGMQPHIVGAPVNLQPPESAFTFEEMHFSKAYGEGVPGSTQENPVFDPPNSGKSLLRFSRNSGSELSFVVVNSVLWEDALWTSQTGEDASSIIGTDITPPADVIHQDPEGRNGYVLFEKAYYDGLGDDRVYDRSTREGQIIPVNETTAQTPTENQMVVV